MSQLDEHRRTDQAVIRILLVDDHEMVREGLKSILARDDDLQVVGEAASADDLLELVERTAPDVVLLDAQLPGVAGPQACRRLLGRYPDMRVLFVSSYSDEELLRECVASGAHGYVVKDIARFELKQAIRAVSRGAGAVSPVIAGRMLDELRAGPVHPASPDLSASQRRILELISQGYRNREIATQLHLSENTIKSHVQEIFRKLDVRNRA
ncbi:MAG: two-component system, NarL family, response regulator DevR, partial [Actinomycetota bacterium]|nr:two-component system, NarL family, response regulator DevR [Actinomycetota bacterium]